MKTKLYPFKGGNHSIFEIWKYYSDKGIQLNKNHLRKKINQKIKEIGTENINEKMVNELIIEIARNRVLSATVPGDIELCIQEFGKENWDKAKKEANKKRINLKESIKVAPESLKPIQKSETMKNIEIGENYGRFR